VLMGAGKPVRFGDRRRLDRYGLGVSVRRTGAVSRGRTAEPVRFEDLGPPDRCGFAG